MQFLTTDLDAILVNFSSMLSYEGLSGLRHKRLILLMQFLVHHLVLMHVFQMNVPSSLENMSSDSSCHDLFTMVKSD